jgi:hypothetical protein
VKKDLLKSKYDIEWRSIGEMNPDEIFDWVVLLKLGLIIDISY